MRPSRSLFVLPLALGLTLGVALPAAAAWVVGAPVGDASAAGTTVNPPSTPTSTVTGSSVSLSWTPPAAGATPSGYSVVRTAPTPAPVCTAISTTTCTDTGLSPTTTYTYEITALVGIWVSAPLVAVATTADPLPSAFLVTAPSTPPATVTAGVSFSVTIQARTTVGTNDTTYTGPHNLTFSGPGTVGGYAPVYPATAVFDAGGQATVTVTLYRAESVTITVADGDPQRTGVSGSVTVAAGVANSLRWTTDAAGLIDACPTGTVVVGPGGQRSWYVAELDQYGNRTVEAAGGRTVTFSRTPGGASGGTFGPGSLTIAGGASPAVTSGTVTLKLKKKAPVATTFTASPTPAAGISSVSCTLSL